MRIMEIFATRIRRGSERFSAWCRKRTYRLRSSASVGQSFLIWAVAFVGLISFVGFVVDTGLIYLHQVWLGQAVDAASLAAGHELPNIRASCARAVEYLEANGYEVGTDFSFQIIYPEWPDAPEPPGNPGEFVIDSVDDRIEEADDCASVTFDARHTNMHFEVEISATQEISLLFMHLLGWGDVNVGAPSLVERSFRFDIVMILDRSGSMKFDTCSLLRSTDEYGCENRYGGSSVFFNEDFEDDNDLADVEADGWVLRGGRNIRFNGGSNAVDLSCNDEPLLEDPDPYTWDFTCVDEAISGSIMGYSNVLLDNCTVQGNVDVNDGHLYSLGSRIEGNVKVRDTWLYLDGSIVTGLVDGNSQTIDDLGYIITDNTIDSNVKVMGGGYLRITGNAIGLNLDVNCPTIVVAEGGNVVNGIKNLCGSPIPPAECAGISRTISTVGYDEDVSLFLTLEEDSLDPGDALEVYWRPNDGVGWSKIAEFEEQEIPDGIQSAFGVVLPSAAYDNPDFQLRFEVETVTDQWLTLDNIQLRTMADNPGPWVWYKPDNNTGCWTNRPMTCEIDDWDTLAPGVSIGGEDPPMAQLMEQPMTDTLLAAEAFIDMVDARRQIGSPRQDFLGLVAYESNADKLHDLTTDYEAIKQELFNNFRAWGGTNLGGGIRVGLDVLNNGRWNTTHYMILLTDGWPNFYDDQTYTDPTRFGRRCVIDGYYTNNPCRESLIYIDTQVEQAILNNVTIFAIGLGADLDVTTFDVSGVPGWADGSYTGMDLLERIAESTNGQAYHAPTTEELEEIFYWIAEAIFIRIIR